MLRWRGKKRLDLQAVMAALDEAGKRGATIDEAMARFNPAFLEPRLVGMVLRRSPSLETAKRFFDWSSRQEGYNHDTYCYTRMLHHLVGARRTGEAIEFFKRELCAHCRPSVYSFTIVIQCLCDSMNPARAWRYIGYMKTLGVLPDVTAYNVVIKGYCDIGRVDRALVKLAKMARRCKPSVVTYNTVINGLCKFGKIDWGVFLFERMTGLEGLSYSYEGDKAIMKHRHLFTGLPHELVDPDGFTYSTLIHGLCEADRIDAAAKIYKMMLDANYDGDAAAYNAMADGFCKERRVDEALEVLKTMIQRGCKPSVVTYNCIISGVCQYKNRTEEAYGLFRQMIGSDCPPNAVTYGTMILGLGKIHRVDQCRELFEGMIDAGLMPDRYVYHALVYAYVKVRKLEMAKSVLLQEAAAAADVFMYTTLIGGYCRSWKRPKIDEALMLFQNMKDRRIWPNVITYNVVLRGLCRSDRFDEAYGIFQEMFKVKCSPNRMTFKVMTMGMIRSGKTDRFEKIFMDMVYKGRWQGEGPLLKQHGLIDITDEERREFFIKAAASNDPGNPVEAILKGQYY